MEYRGHVDNGMIRPEEPLQLPNGTEVEFHVVNGTNGTAGPAAREELREANDRFWTNKSLDELLRKHRAKRIKSLDDLGAVWPDDGDSIDEFLERVRESRR
jgi:hypothetical protein